MRARTAPLAIAIALAVALAAPVNAFPLGIDDIGSGGQSGGGTSNGTAGTLTYYEFTPNYAAFKRYTAGGTSEPDNYDPDKDGKTNEHYFSSWVVNYKASADDRMERAALEIRGDMSGSINDHWNVYISRPAENDVGLDGTANDGPKPPVVMNWETSEDGPALYKHGAVFGTPWERTWHIFWAGGPHEADGLIEPGRPDVPLTSSGKEYSLGAPRMGKTDNVDSSKNDPHRHDTDMQSVNLNKWGYAGKSDSDRFHWMSDYYDYFRTNGTNGVVKSGGNWTPDTNTVSFDMGKIENQLTYMEGRYAIYAYRLGLRENMLKVVDPGYELVRRPRVRFIVRDQAGNPIPGAEARLVLAKPYVPKNAPVSNPIGITLATGKDGATPYAGTRDGKPGGDAYALKAEMAGASTALYVGRIASHDEDDHGARTYAYPRLTDGPTQKLVGVRASQVVTNPGYTVSVTFPEGYEYLGSNVAKYDIVAAGKGDAGPAGNGFELKVANATWSPTTSPTTPYWKASTRTVTFPGSGGFSKDGQIHAFTSSAGSSVGAYGGLYLGDGKAGLYEFTITAKDVSIPPSASANVTYYYDANHDHARDAGEQRMANPDFSSITRLVPTGETSETPRINAGSTTAYTIEAMPGTWVLQGSIGDPSRFRVSYVRVNGGYVDSVYRDGSPLPMRTGAQQDWATDYGDAVSTPITLAKSGVANVEIGIDLRAGGVVPAIDSPRMIGPNAWLDSKREADFGFREDIRAYSSGSSTSYAIPYLGIVSYPTEPDWAASHRDGYSIPYSTSQVRNPNGDADPASLAGTDRWTFSLMTPKQVWTAPNAERLPRMADGYSMPAGSLTAKYATAAEALDASPEFVVGGDELDGWSDSYRKGVNYYGAILWRVRASTVTVDNRGVETRTVRQYFQWTRPTVKNVKVYTSTGSL